MLKRFEVSNYRNFKDKLEIDFGKVGGYQFNPECITDNTICKMLIYGRNATGKTNLGKALRDVKMNIEGPESGVVSDGLYLNADSKETMASFKYVFQFGSSEITYLYQKLAEYHLYDEELLIDDKRIFYYNFVTKKNDFGGLGELDADTVKIDRYLKSMDSVNGNDGPTLPFLRWVINNTALKEGSILLKLDDFIRRMVITTGSKEIYQTTRFYTALDNNDSLKDLEDFLNVMGIECKLVMRHLPDGQKELYFKHDKLVPFMETASSGTHSLLSLYRFLVMGKTASLLYIDEFDAFYHYEMSEKVIHFLEEKYPSCQIIITTHNTNLMSNKLMRPDCLFILSGRGTLTALCDATERELREGHNLEKMYISGEFEKYE